MTFSIQRTIVASLFFVSMVVFSITEAVAGVLAGSPTIYGPGVPIGMPNAVSGAVNNDDYTGSGLTNPNLITFAGISITGFLPIDLSIPVANTGGTTEYFLDLGNAVNQTGIGWSGFRVEIGGGIGGAFQRSTTPIAGVSGLDFDFPIPNPVLSSPDFPAINHGADLVIFSGGVVSAGATATGQDFAFDIPDIVGGPAGYSFTIRLQAVPIPELSTLALAVCGLLSITATRIRKRASISNSANA